MKFYLLLFLLFGMFAEVSGQELIFNNPSLYETYTEFKSDMKEEGVIITRDMLNLKYLLVEEGLKNGPDLSGNGLESQSSPDKRYILLSSEVLVDSSMLKAAMYRELTNSLQLGLTEEDSKILMKRPSNYDYTQITTQDYNDLVRLIKQKMNIYYQQIIIPIEG